MDPLYYVFAGLVIVLPGVYMYISNVVNMRLPTLQNKRICLLIAHPDDEAMFFSPTVLALTRPEMGNHVKILCLSTGNAAGLGETRKKELVKSGMLLGLEEEDDVFVIDCPNDFPDSMEKTWDTTKINALLSSAFAPDDSSPNIDTLITFDVYGISSHPNHVSLYVGARSFIAKLAAAAKAKGEGEGNKVPVDLYTLTTVSFIRKYASFFDMFNTLARWMCVENVNGAHPESLVFMNSLTGERGLRRAWKAMTEAHKSQMVWFRYGWITLSRYMVINDLKLEKVSRQ